MTNKLNDKEKFLKAIGISSDNTSLEIVARGIAAETIRYAVNQIVPDKPCPTDKEFWPDEDEEREWQTTQLIRNKFLELATLLENY